MVERCFCHNESIVFKKIVNCDFLYPDYVAYLASNLKSCGFSDFYSEPKKERVVYEHKVV